MFFNYDDEIIKWYGKNEPPESQLDLYYIPPSNKSFNEVKEKAIEIWKTYDDTYKYATEKINRIKDLENISDNFMYIVAMFDYINQGILATKLSEETKEQIHQRILAGGGLDYIFNS